MLLLRPGDGSVVVCDPTHDNELFWSVIGTAGTVALVIGAQLRLMPATGLVRSTYTWYSDLSQYCDAVVKRIGVPVYLEGVVYGERAMVLVEASFVSDEDAKSSGLPVQHPGPLPECGA